MVGIDMQMVQHWCGHMLRAIQPDHKYIHTVLETYRVLLPYRATPLRSSTWRVVDFSSTGMTLLDYNA